MNGQVESRTISTASIRAPKSLAAKVNLLARIRNEHVSDYVASRLADVVARDWDALPPEVRKYLESHMGGN